MIVKQRTWWFMLSTDRPPKFEEGEMGIFTKFKRKEKQVKTVCFVTSRNDKVKNS